MLCLLEYMFLRLLKAGVLIYVMKMGTKKRIVFVFSSSLSV